MMIYLKNAQENTLNNLRQTRYTFPEKNKYSRSPLFIRMRPCLLIMITIDTL